MVLIREESIPLGYRRNWTADSCIAKKSAHHFHSNKKLFRFRPVGYHSSPSSGHAALCAALTNIGRLAPLTGDAMTQMVAKICCVCGKDVSQVKRTKDVHANYYCNPCYAAKVSSEGVARQSDPVASVATAVFPDE